MSPPAVQSRAGRALRHGLWPLLLSACAATYAGVIVVPPHAAQTPKEEAAEVDLELDRYEVSPGGWAPVASAPGSAPRLMLGTKLRVCATPQRDGHVQLELIDGAGVKLLYPPPDAQGRPGPAQRVSAHVRLCLGDGADAELKVSRPFGRTQLRYVFWRDAGSAATPARRGLAGLDPAGSVWLIEYDAVPP